MKKANRFNNRMKRSNWGFRTWLLPLVLAGLFFPLADSTWAQCGCTSITSAILYASPDDIGNFYVQGQLIGTFTYVSKGTGAQPQTLTLTPAQIALLNPCGTNCLAALNQNTLCCEMSLSWVLDLTCNTGQHSYMSSDNYSSLNLTAYYDATGTNPPANDGSGNPWYSPNWTGSFPSTFTPACENEFFWAKRIYDPATGQWACALAPTAAENPPTYNPPNYAYYRQCMPVTWVTPPGPPNLTITKTALGPVSQINTGMPVTYQAVVCNSGTNIGSPVTVLDNMPPGFSYAGPGGGPPQGYYAWPNFIFSEGFPGAPIGGGSACVTLQYWAIDYSVNSSDYCQTRYNSVTIQSYNAAATAAVTMFCPTGTATYTPTPTFTPTPTWTPTHLPYTLTPTPTYTPTPTWTSTFPPGTNTPTPPYTATPTFSPTATWSPSNTPTPGPGCWIPFTPFRSALSLLSWNFQGRQEKQGHLFAVNSHGCSMAWTNEQCWLEGQAENNPSRKAGRLPLAKIVQCGEKEPANLFQGRTHVRPS